MELKLGQERLYYGRVRLLIVPYGIETYVQRSATFYTALLIVPYGIETAIRSTEMVKRKKLLIVPYGIETGFGKRGKRTG